MILAAVTSVVTVSAAFAGGSASGAIHVAAGDGHKKNIEFIARAGSDGAGEGQMTFSGPAELPDSEEEGTGKGLVANLHLKIDFDCVVVNENRAAMSGIIRDANVDGYAGRRALLSVEDGGEGKNAAPDKFTWGMYNGETITWFPTDAEVDGDSGWKYSWIATDAERPDDVGVPNRRSTAVDCRSFSLSSYDYIDIPQGAGNVQVRK